MSSVAAEVAELSQRVIACLSHYPVVARKFDACWVRNNLHHPDEWKSHPFVRAALDGNPKRGDDTLAPVEMSLAELHSKKAVRIASKVKMLKNDVANLGATLAELRWAAYISSRHPEGAVELDKRIPSSESLTDVFLNTGDREYWVEVYAPGRAGVAWDTLRRINFAVEYDPSLQREDGFGYCLNVDCPSPRMVDERAVNLAVGEVIDWIRRGNAILESETVIHGPSAGELCITAFPVPDGGSRSMLPGASSSSGRFVRVKELTAQVGCVARQKSKDGQLYGAPFCVLAVDCQDTWPLEGPLDEGPTGGVHRWAWENWGLPCAVDFLVLFRFPPGQGDPSAWWIASPGLPPKDLRQAVEDLGFPSEPLTARRMET